MSALPPIGGLIRLALTLVDGGAIRRNRPATAGMVGVGVAGVAAGALALAALICGLVALWIFDLPYVGAAGAALITAGILLVLSLGLLAWMRHALRLPPPPAASVAPALLLAEATRFITEHKGPMLLAAILAGLVAARSEK